MSRASIFLEQYPDAQIRGGQIVGIQDAMGESAHSYFEQAGLVNVQPDEWYSMAQYVKVIYDIVNHESGIMSKLVSIGIYVVEHALLPPEIDTLEKGLRAMQHGWNMNSRQAKDVIWTVEKLDNKTFICTNSSPFPADQEYGVLYGFARRFSGGQGFTVNYENPADRNDENKESIRFTVKVD